MTDRTDAEALRAALAADHPREEIDLAAVARLLDAQIDAAMLAMVKG